MGIVRAEGSASGRRWTWPGSVWRDLRAASPAQKSFWAALALVLALGTFLRLNGFVGHQSSLWLDEALWAPRFVEKPLLSLAIRPLGFVWLTRQLITHFGATEFWLRFLPNLGGILSLWLMPYVASRLLRSRVLQVLLVLLFALHPALIDLAKEFKPYSFEVLVHLLSFALVLRYEQTRKVRYFYALVAYLPVAFLLAYNFAFALPGLLLLAMWFAVKRVGRIAMVATVLSFCVCLAAVVGINRVSVSKIERNGHNEAYWGGKYDVFYEPNAEQSRLGWTLSKAQDMTAMIGQRRDLWTTGERMSYSLAGKLGTVDTWFWSGLSLLGAGWLAYKRRAEAALWFLPLLMLGVVNAFGKWPLGQFRTNLFVVVYLFPLPLLGIEMLASLARGWLKHAAVAVIAFEVALGFAFGFDWRGHKITWCQDGYTREVLAALYEMRDEQLARSPTNRRLRVVFDLYAHKPLQYYLGVHPTTMKLYADFGERFISDKVGSKSLVKITRVRFASGAPVLAVASKPSTVAALKAFADSHRNRVRSQREIGGRVLIVLLDK